MDRNRSPFYGDNPGPILVTAPYACTTSLRAKKSKRFTMVSNVSVLLYFLVALIISTVIIYYIAKFFGAKDSLTTALLAALIGTAVYTIFYYVLGQGLIAAFVAGIVWLLALQKLYTIGWFRALIIAVVIWIVTSIAGYFLPVLMGPI
jgi:hypothetical protein